jgi:hypothetical protein
MSASADESHQRDELVHAQSRLSDDCAECAEAGLLERAEALAHAHGSESGNNYPRRRDGCGAAGRDSAGGGDDAKGGTS